MDESLLIAPMDPLHATSPSPIETGVSTFVTTTALLDGLKDPRNGEAWGGFLGRYRPVVVGYARKLGVPESEAEDVAQTAIAEFARGFAAGSYDRNKGRLRGWLFGIAHNQILLGRRKRARQDRYEAAGREELVDQGAEPGEFERMWEREWQDHLLRRCLEALRALVKAQTLDAFVMFVLDGQSAELVGERLGMTTNAVFGAKRRVLEHIRELKLQFEAEE